MDLRSEVIPHHDQWNSILRDLPNGHLLQSWEWGALKSRFGWHADRRVWWDSQENPRAAAQILTRRMPAGLQVLYCPRGPALDWGDQALYEQVLSDLRQRALNQKAIFLKIDPDVPLGFGVPDSEEASPAPSGETVSAYLKREGWRFSREQIQFRNTLTLDLGPSEEELMAGMKQKTRYNVRLAGRKGVTVREGGPEDLHLLYTIYAETALRDSFTIRSWDYYQQAWGSFVNAGLAQPFIAEVESVPVAGLLAYRFGNSAYYLFGMSRELHRKKMPNYLLQWEAIRWAKKSGCRIYDFWGAPEVFKRSDPMWGVYRFKRGFGPRIVRTLGAWDFPVRPFIYWLYGFLLPRILSVLRARGRKQTREALS